MNYMGEIAKMLGVELGERFDIQYEGSKMKHCHISKHGLYDKNMNLAHGALTSILTGTAKIVRAPFRPKNGDRYYFVLLNGTVGNTCFAEGSTFDNMALYAGNCFRTEAEAKRHKEEIMAKFREVMG